MHIYLAYINPKSDKDNLVLVKDGFSIYPAVLTVLWALHKRIWWLVVATILWNCFVYYLESNFSLTYTSIFLLRIQLFLFLGFLSEDIYCFDLERKGYKLREIILASCAEEAELKYYSRIIE